MSARDALPMRQTIVASPAMAGLLMALQAQILEEAGHAPGAATLPAGGVVLLPIGYDSEETPTWRVSEWNPDQVELRDHARAEHSFLRRRFRPKSWEHMPWHPSHWHEYITMVDAEGRKWHHSGGIHVVDDFGRLARLPEAFQ